MGQLEAVDIAGHHDIGEQQVDLWHRLDEPQTLGAVLGLYDSVALVGQIRARDLQNVFVVVDDQDCPRYRHVRALAMRRRYHMRQRFAGKSPRSAGAPPDETVSAPSIAAYASRRTPWDLRRDPRSPRAPPPPDSRAAPCRRPRRRRRCRDCDRRFLSRRGSTWASIRGSAPPSASP